MTEFPEQWEVVALKEITSYSKGKKPKILKDVQREKTIPYIDIKAFEKGEIRQYADIPSSNIAAKDDVLVVWDGARSGLVGIGQEGAIGSTILALKPININCKYLYRFIQSQYELINSNPRGTGIPHVDPEVFWNIKLPLPPLNEQRRIIAKLEKLLHKVDACKERLDKIPTILKHFRQSVLATACSGRLTADWREKNPDVEPAKELLKRVSEKNGSRKNVANQKSLVSKPTDFEIPESWELVLSDDLISFVTSGSRGWAKYYADKGSLFIRIGNLDHGTISPDLTSVQRVNPPKGAEGTRTRIQSNDILISITADVGMIALAPHDLEESYINQHIALARPLKGFSAEYLAWYLASSEGGLRQFQDLQRGMTKVGLGLGDIKSVWVPFPPFEEQQEIVHRVEAFFKKADEIEKRYQKAKVFVDKLTQSILAKTFRGELVSQDPDDEPASVLLERIRKERAKRELGLKGRGKTTRKTKTIQRKKK